MTVERQRDQLDQRSDVQRVGIADGDHGGEFERGGGDADL